MEGRLADHVISWRVGWLIMSSVGVSHVLRCCTAVLCVSNTIVDYFKSFMEKLLNKAIGIG